MRRIFFLAVIGICQWVTLNAQKTVINDPNAEVRAAGNFSAIDISGGINLYLSQGDEDGVAVSASEINYRDHIKTFVENGVLKIWYQEKGWKYRSGNKKLIAYVSFKSIKALTASGASDVYVNGIIKCPGLTLRLSGASDFKGGIETDKLSVNQSGASDATVTGKAPVLEIEASGASNFKGYNLETENCSAKASGASDIRITVTKELNAYASGASSIYYKGEGVPKGIRSNGASNITKKM
jgi:hypothetical protein